MLTSKMTRVTLPVVASAVLLTALAQGAARAATDTPAPGAPAALATPAAPKTSELFGDSVVAKGKGVEVKRSQIDEEMIRFKSQAAARGQRIPTDQVGLIETRILQQIIQLQLLNARATDADKVLGRETAQKRVSEARAQLGDEEMFNMRLKAEGLTQEQLLAKWSEAATAETVIKREIKVEVSDDTITKFYNDNPAKFEQPEMVKAAHILLSTLDDSRKELPEDKKAAKRKLADDLLKRAKAGEDFAKLAKEFSEDPGSKNRGGEYTFPRGQMVPEFEAAAFSLETNQVSDLVTTQFGYHIIKLYEKLPAKKLELAKVKPDLKEALEAREVQKQLPDYTKKLQQEAGVEILDESLKPKETPETGAAPAPAATEKK